ncbi:tyrosine-type recombinase/integrase [Peptoniphilus sp. KCTC 25270]|uniref:site-specific integrase n=1 Tax=Peptoniphilus sp. KCTC 25270 TaxID=2897414 RepID=UPI001E3130D3|nr:tyrosine-type recombinase/integrase [Peptoniphilus sp. KCTC 25270]MCD1147760.1 tyrosine-type recombinase/integrase [Peptoniphilus sp. KCTC 25270]
MEALKITSVSERNAEIIADYFQNCRLRGLSKNTLKNYRVTLFHLFDWLESENLEITEVRPRDLNNYFLESFIGMRPSTKHAKISSLRTFFEYLMMIGEVEQSPVLKIMLPKIEKAKKKAFTDEAYKSLVAYLEEHGGEPCVFMAELMRYSGFRIGETVTLDITKDIQKRVDMETGEVAYFATIHGKGAKDRIVKVYSRKAQEIIEKHLEKIREYQTDLPYIISVSASTFSFHLVEWRRKTDQKTHFTSHDMRRAFAQDLMESTGNIELVRTLLGHDSYNTSLIYLWKDSEQVYGNSKEVGLYE